LSIESMRNSMQFAKETLPTPPSTLVSIWKEFREFAFQGGAVDLAVGIILGGAFGKVVSSLVNDVVMPPIGWLLRGVDFANIFFLLKRGKKNAITRNRYKTLAQAKDDGAITVNYGVFLNSVINFMVISIIVFALVRTVNKLKLKNKGASKARECPHCFMKIDLRATKCPFCTTPIESEPSSEGNEEDSSDAEGKPKVKFWKKNLKKQLSSSGLLI